MSAVVVLAMGQATTERPGSATGTLGNTAGHGEARRIEGQWEVVYVEMDGKKIENKSFANVTIQGNKLTCRHDGKEKNMDVGIRSASPGSRGRDDGRRKHNLQHRRQYRDDR